MSGLLKTSRSEAFTFQMKSSMHSKKTREVGVWCSTEDLDYIIFVTPCLQTLKLQAQLIVMQMILKACNNMRPVAGALFVSAPDDKKQQRRLSNSSHKDDTSPMLTACADAMIVVTVLYCTNMSDRQANQNPLAKAEPPSLSDPGPETRSWIIAC